MSFGSMRNAHKFNDASDAAISFRDPVTQALQGAVGDIMAFVSGLGFQPVAANAAGVPTGTGTDNRLVRWDGSNNIQNSNASLDDAGNLTLAAALSTANGGTGFSTYTVGDMLYASASTILSTLADVATGNALISGGVEAAPSWGKIGLTTHVSGTLPIANGGTNQTVFTDGHVVYYAAGASQLSGSASLFWDQTLLSLRCRRGDSTAIPTSQAVDLGAGLILQNLDAAAVYTGIGFRLRTASTSIGLLGFEHTAGFGELFVRIKDTSTTSKEVLRISNSVVRVNPLDLSSVNFEIRGDDGESLLASNAASHLLTCQTFQSAAVREIFQALPTGIEFNRNQDWVSGMLFRVRGNSVFSAFVVDPSLNSVGVGNVPDSGSRLRVYQGNAAAAIPVVELHQEDTDKPFMKATGTGTAGNLNRSLVQESDVTTATRVGWFRAGVGNLGTGLASGDYFVPMYTLA